MLKHDLSSDEHGLGLWVRLIFLILLINTISPHRLKRSRGLCCSTGAVGFIIFPNGNFRRIVNPCGFSAKSIAGRATLRGVAFRYHRNMCGPRQLSFI